MVETLWDKITQFVSPEAGQARSRALNEAIGYYIPPEMRGLLGLVADATPSASYGRAAQASQEMVAPGRTPMQRIGSAGEMLSSTAEIAAPMAVAGRAGMPVAQAVQEGLLGFSAGADDVGRRFVERMNQPGPVPTMYSNPLRVFHGGKDLITSPRATVDPEGLLPGFSVTPDERVAGMYAGMRGGDAVSSFDIDKSKLSSIGEMELYDLQDFLEVSRGLDEGDLPQAELLKELQDRGINAIKYADPEFGMRILDPSILRSVRVADELPAPRNEAEAMARQVLELRAAGRAGDVTEEMRAAADPQYMFANTPLPMDEVSRMARAREMGRVDPQYHATLADFPAFMPSETGLVGRGVYTGDFPTDIEDYARKQGTSEGLNIIPLLVPSEQTYARRIDWQNLVDADEAFPWNATVDETVQGFKRAADTMSAQGYPGVNSQPGERVTFDPANIRSRFALFDPEFAHLRNLSAGVGGLGLLGLGAYDAQQGEQY